MKSKYKKAMAHGKAYANGLYNDFIKCPEDLGPNFTWEGFPFMCGRLATVSLFNMFSDRAWYSFSQKQRNELEEFCYNFTVKTAKELLEAEDGEETSNGN
uniref:Uncharacterized protein n=1 Tax=viral metagenome TaxID=1070528 RepID=A0A6M3JFJ5_9ZZZZ